MIEVSASTKANVPIMERALFGEKGISVRIEIMRKYTLAIRRNCISKESGSQESSVYRVVRTRFVCFMATFRCTRSLLPKYTRPVSLEE